MDRPVFRDVQRCVVRPYCAAVGHILCCIGSVVPWNGHLEPPTQDPRHPPARTVSSGFKRGDYVHVAVNSPLGVKSEIKLCDMSPLEPKLSTLSTRLSSVAKKTVRA